MTAPDIHPWRLTTSCCGFHQTVTLRSNWDELDAIRTAYLTDPPDGHHRVGIIDRAEQPNTRTETADIDWIMSRYLTYRQSPYRPELNDLLDALEEAHRGRPEAP